MAMKRYEAGDAVKVTDAVGKVFRGEVVRCFGDGDGIGVDIRVPAGHQTATRSAPRANAFAWSFYDSELAQEPFGDYGLRIEPWAEVASADPQPGDIVYAKEDFFVELGGGDDRQQRLTKGKGYEIARFGDRGSLWIRSCDKGHECSWGTQWRENFSTEPLADEPKSDLVLLDDESRKALKAGDRVLVEMEVQALDAEDALVLLTTKHATVSQPWRELGVVYAKLPAAEPEKPIAVGDFVSILRRTGSRGKVLAFMSNGHAVVEYVAGDDFNVGHYDVSCLERV